MDSTEDFEVHGLHIQVVDDDDVEIAGAKVLLEGPERIETKTDDHGWITIDGLSRGTYTVRVSGEVTEDDDDDVVCELELVVPTPRAVEHEVKSRLPTTEAPVENSPADTPIEPASLAAATVATPTPASPTPPATAVDARPVPVQDSTTAPVEKPKGIDVPIYVSHFHENHFMPHLIEDEFLEVLAGVAAFHKEHGVCPLELHPDVGAENKELNDKRLKFAECVVHGDEETWKELTKEATTRDVQTFLKYFASKGWPCDPGKVDGEEGPKTHEAIFQFQHACNVAWGMNLKVDGSFGPKTWAGALLSVTKVIGTHSSSEK
ncbi:MAG: hypothetical protein IPN71_01345 [Fibrobacteres bacterium]|nr:hypothetical protein [Fibrobacterota bacterium]